MDSLKDLDIYRHNVKSTKVKVKREIIDNEYNVAVRDFDTSNTENILHDSNNYMVKHNQEVDTNMLRNINKPEKKSEADTATVTESVKCEIENVVNENQNEKQTNLKKENETEEREVLKIEATTLDEEVKVELVEIKPEGVPTSAIAGWIGIDYRTEGNEGFEERAEKDYHIDSENKFQMEKFSDQFCNITAQKEFVKDNTDVCKREESGASYETGQTIETDHQFTLEKKGYKCEICKKTFIKKSSLSSHEITHTGETPFKCQFCNKGFNVRSNLNVHLRIHTGQRPHVCEICQKTFRQAGQLKSHERIHKGEKPYTCSMCSRSFRNSSALITHQRTHTGERPFPCDLCSRSFSTSTSLKTHRITHSGTMLYDCPVCGRQFNRKNNLNVHIKRHNKNRKFSCLKCSNGFVMRAHLLGHLKRAHKVDIHSEQINTFLDSCEDNIEGNVIKNEQELGIKNEEEFESKTTGKLHDEFKCSGNKDEFGREEMEVKRDIDDF